MDTHQSDASAEIGVTTRLARILVVDEDPALRHALCDSLELQGFDVAESGDGSHVVAEVGRAHPDLVILDLDEPDLSGFDVLRELRGGSAVPVIVVSGRVDELDRVLGLELGADDYVVKPVSTRELASRVRAVLRRCRTDGHHVLAFNELTIDPTRHRVTVRGSVVALRAKEFELLLFLASSPQRVFTRAEILEQVWHSQADWQDVATVTEHVRRLRMKLEGDVGAQRWIRTVRGVGYAFEP